MTMEELLWQSELFLRIIISCICGCIIGYERKNRNKEAGIRTHAIVCIGSSLIMIISKYGFFDTITTDASRIASQIVSGIGFLGAGIIFVKNQAVSGLTTAAGIWATSGIGMAVGAGMYIMGILTTLLIVLTQVIMHKETVFTRRPFLQIISITLKNREGVIEKIQENLRYNNIELSKIEIEKEHGDNLLLTAEIIIPPGYNESKWLDIISKERDILRVEVCK
ncbi:MgtC/SapB family protein [Clostridium polynesiense]|uniref:MgtC/SapB family protein n=1 Tax=Clostridium polynesiense TaxID=1325933 RepID=UPI00058FC33F|nr:MgtC/SapB family protein [Clostridium polynesiense]